MATGLYTSVLFQCEIDLKLSVKLPVKQERLCAYRRTFWVTGTSRASAKETLVRASLFSQDRRMDRSIEDQEKKTARVPCGGTHREREGQREGSRTSQIVCCCVEQNHDHPRVARGQIDRTAQYSGVIYDSQGSNTAKPGAGYCAHFQRASTGGACYGESGAAASSAPDVALLRGASPTGGAGAGPSGAGGPAPAAAPGADGHDQGEAAFPRRVPVAMDPVARTRRQHGRFCRFSLLIGEQRAAPGW